MKKEVWTAFTLLVAIASGCGGPDQAKQERLLHLSSQVEAQSAEIKTLAEQNKQLESKNAELQKNLDELLHGAQRSIIEIRKQYESKNYDQVIDLAAKLHGKFQGTPEDKEAQNFVKQIHTVREKEKRLKQEEEKKKQAELKKSAKEKARALLRVTSISPSSPNSASGVDLYIQWKNTSSKVIKYATFEVVPYNAVDDVVYCEIRGHSNFRALDTGPFKKGQGNASGVYWENAWYNSTIKYVKLEGVDIEYMDGTTISLTGEDLNYIQY